MFDFSDNNYIEFMGFRTMVVENKIDEIMEQVHAGKTRISFDPEDLSEDEIAYVKEQIRIRSGADSIEDVNEW